jgi:hypothetical protein
MEHDTLDIPLGVECAWPGCTDPILSIPGSRRQHRLAEAWRRLLRALQPSRRSNWLR